MAEMMDRKKLIKYLPDFMQKFSEIKELMRVTNIESDQIYPLIGKCLDEAFIEDCSEYGIRKYENCLHIIPDESETLETRKLRILMRWHDYAPYTFRVLVNKLNMICGVNNYDLQENLTRYEIKLFTHLKLPWQIKEIENLLLKILPMNVNFEINNEIQIDDLATIYSPLATTEIICCKFIEREV